MTTVVDAMASAAHQVWAVRSEIVAVAAALSASYLLYQIVVRLDGNSREPVGRGITRLALALFITLVATHTAWNSVDVTYGSAAIVLLLGGFAGQLSSSRAGADKLHPKDEHGAAGLTGRSDTRGGHEGHRLRRASGFLLQGGALLLLLLWVVQHTFAKVAPQQSSPAALLTTFVATGLMAMAIVQGLRTLLPLRGVFHRLALERWIDDAIAAPIHALPQAGSAAEPLREVSPRAIRRAITRLAQGPIAADKYALLDLPIEQLCGQIAAGADRLLDEPSVAPYDATDTPRASEVTVTDVLTALAAGSRDVARFLELAKTTRAALQRGAHGEAPGSREYMQLRANLSQRIQRNIDGLQIGTTFWWRRTLRGLVFVVCGVEGLSVLPGDATLAAICAVVGGFVATASRDVIAIVEKARR